MFLKIICFLIILQLPLCVSVAANRILFSEDFNNRNIGNAPPQLTEWTFLTTGGKKAQEGFTMWEITEYNGGKALYVNFNESSGTASMALITPVGSPDWSDYSLEFDMTVLSNRSYPNGYSFSVPYRIMEIDKGNAFTVFSWHNLFAVSEQVSLGNYWSTRPDCVLASAQPFHSTFTVKVEIFGDTAKFFKNNVFCLESSVFDIPRRGFAGIAMANDWTYGFDAIIDNVKVTDLSASLKRGDGETVNYSLCDGKTGVLIICYYDDNNRLLSLETKPVNGTGTAPYTAAGSRAKAFLWNSLSGDKPMILLCPYLDIY